MALSNVIVAEAMLEDKLADIWPDYSCLYDVRCPEFQGFVHIFRLAAFKHLRLRRNNKGSSKTSLSSDDLESCSLGASISHVQWSLNIVHMHIRVISWADSFARAHTWAKCSLVYKIIQHVEYLAPMARVTKCTENGTAHWRNLLTPTVTSDT